MALHLIKLCVGCDSIQDLEAWIVERRRMPGGSPTEHIHTTRMVPKRGDALLDGGSLYWVIKGQLACRQRLLDVRPFTDGEGIGRCRLVLEPVVMPVRPRPYRPFQGWRYLEPDDAPPDLGSEAADVSVLPETMRRELVALGLL
ncbi:DUF1489 family protein [Enterovirga sp. CN4-39]|uniref:DUF1489 family protein n=1 Tax=Enterovirga sp. CN4-39 TaxID=3400910 RepID=UPI003C069877